MRPEDVPDAWIDAAATGGEPSLSATCGQIYVPFDLRAAIAAVAPLIQAAERERCAAWHMAEAERIDNDRTAMGSDAIPLEWSKHHRCDAASIRAMKDSEGPAS